MAVGNMGGSSDKGRNIPYQLNVLKALQRFVDNSDALEGFLASIDGNTDGIEPLLTQILATLQSDKDFEASFVKDANGQVWLEVRTLDIDTNTWTISYYLPGDLTPHQPQPGDPAGPLGPLSYESPAALLALILAELVAHTALLTDIDNNTDNVESILTNLEACCTAGNLLLQSIDAKDFATETTLLAFSSANNTALGLINTAIGTADANIVAAIQACCTAQGTILSNILTELQTQTGTLTSIDSNTSLVLAELVAQTIQNTAIIAALAPLATETTLASVLAELQGINLDTNGLSQEATQLLVLAALNTVITNTTGLATEVTLLTRLSKADFEARINTLGQKTMALSTPVVLASDQSAIPTTLPTGQNNWSYNIYGNSGAIIGAGAISIAIQNLGSTTITIGGQGVPPGVSVSWEAELGKTLAGMVITSGGAGTSYIVATVY